MPGANTITSLEVYPVFEYGSIIRRCQRDINTFCSKNPVTTDMFDIYTPTNEDTYDTLKEKLQPLITYIDDAFKPNTNPRYVDLISSIDSAIQLKLWVARTYLFYQLLLYATASFLNKTLYDGVYVQHPDYKKYEWRDYLTQSVLNTFKLGIFGSMNPTSDIDIGIQYSGNLLNVKQESLAYIVSHFESLFYIFTEKSSLAYDIETYADMMTVPSPVDPTKDYFYLDARKFGQTQFNEMLTYAGRSIVRNTWLSHNTSATIDSLNFNRIITDPKFNEMSGIKSNEINTVIRDQLQLTFKNIVEQTTWFDDAKIAVKKFTEMDEHAQRYAYYKKVEFAEKLKFKLALTPEQQKALTADNICTLMMAFGDALTYRMESYICAPTVVHVVRILQADAGKIEKYKTTTPHELCDIELKNSNTRTDPYCTIGPYGFILSMLEQIGYMYRFYLTYCPGGSHPDETKCKSKIAKYKIRYENAIALLIRQKTQGGRRHRKHINKTKKRRHLKKKRTLRQRNARQSKK